MGSNKNKVSEAKLKRAVEGEVAEASYTTPKKTIWPPTWLYGVLIVLAVIAVYGQTARFKFIWDDVQINICENPYLKEASWGNLARFWKEEYGKLYIPLIYTVWMGIAEVSRWINPNYKDTDIFNQTNLMSDVFHVANIVVQVVNGLLVWMLFRRFLKRAELAFLGALLFVLHPLAVEPVSWVTGMKDLLSGMCFFVCLYCYMQFHEVKGKGGAKWYWGAFVALILGLTAKPSMVIAPLVVMVLDRYWFGKKWSDGVRLFGGWVVLGAVWTLFIKGMQPMSDVTDKIPSFGDRLWIALDAFGFYWAKFFYPHPIIIDYGRNPEWLMAQEWWIWGGVLTLAALVLLAAWQRSRPYLWLVAIVWICVLPTSGIVPFEYQMRYSTVADRYVYLGLFWMVLLVLLVAERLLNYLKTKDAPLSAGALLGGIALIIIICGVSSYNLSARWQNGVTLYGADVLKNPRSKHLNNNFASAIASRHPNRDFELARVYAARSVDIDPNFYEGLYTLGDVLFFMGRNEEAIKYLRLALESRPDLDLPLNRLLEVLLKEKRYEEAFDAAKYAFTKRNLNYSDDNYWASVSHTAAQRGNFEAAYELIIRAATINPNNYHWQNAVANFALQLGRVEDALKHSRHSLDLKEDNLEGLLSYGKALGLSQQPGLALRQFEKALAQSPNNCDIMSLIAVAKKDLGDIKGAIEAAQEAKRIGLKLGRKDIAQSADKFIQDIGSPTGLEK